MRGPRMHMGMPSYGVFGCTYMCRLMHWSAHARRVGVGASASFVSSRVDANCLLDVAWSALSCEAVRGVAGCPYFFFREFGPVSCARILDVNQLSRASCCRRPASAALFVSMWAYDVWATE